MGGAQIITLTVPCTVTLRVGAHGRVTVDGTTYTGDAAIKTEPGAVLTIFIKPDNGYEIDKVFYNGEDVTAAAKDEPFQTDAADDITMSVTFARKSDPATPKTGDHAMIHLWPALMLSSVTALATLFVITKRKTPALRDSRDAQ